MSARCLVIGAAGQVGGWLMGDCAAAGHAVQGTSFRVPRDGCPALDLADAAAVRSFVRATRPDVVFLAGAFTNVDAAERDPGVCMAVNVGGPTAVAEALRDTGGMLVLFSTDHVFGESLRARTEDESTEPPHVYGASKAAGEAAIRGLLPDRHLILRTSWLFGREVQRKNFVYRAVSTLRRGDELVVPEDQFGSPTFAPNLAAAAIHLWEAGHTGTYHVVGPDSLTRLAFARMIAEVFGLDADLIRGVPTASLGQAALRPGHVLLSRNKVIATLDLDPIRPPRSALIAWRDGRADGRP